MMMFMSKAHNMNNVLRRTIVREWVDFGDMHHVHKLFGIVIGVEAMSHSFFHLLRWKLNNELRLSLVTKTGATGVVAISVTPLICWPMVLPALKKRMSFELRKGLHYLSWVWALALMWHAPSRIYYLIGIPALVYAIDWLLGFFIRNRLIENVFFERYGTQGVAVSKIYCCMPRLILELLITSPQLHFMNPSGYDPTKTSFVYIMLPWITKYVSWYISNLFLID